jgi:hypothetical protein
MWFLFGFVTLAGFVAYTVYRRLDARWKGEPARAGAIDYQFRVDTYKDKIQKLRIGISAPAVFDFALKPETTLDGFFKAIAVSREHQVADEAFDRAVYIVSDDAGMCRKLASSPPVRAGILKLFDLKGQSYRVDGVRCHQGRLWVRCSPDGKPRPEEAALAAAQIVPVLAELAHALRDVPPDGSGKPARDPFVLRATLILACSSGLAINGVVQLMRVHWDDFPFIVEPFELLLPAVVVGAAVTALLGAAAIAFLKRTARTHLVLLEIALVGCFGAVATAYVEVRDLNIEWDRKEGVTYEAAITGKKVRTARRSPDRYYVSVEPLQYPGSSEIRVPRSAYNRLSVKDRVKLHVRPGLLGARWVERLEGPNGIVVN